MSQPYSSTADVVNNVLKKFLTDAKWNMTSNLPSAPSDVDYRIREGDGEIDARLAAMGYALPFTSNPPLLKSISIMYARYACFRDVFAGGSPGAGTDAINNFKNEFEERLQKLEDGWLSLLDASGQVIVPASSKFGVGVAINTAPIDEKPGQIISSYVDAVDSNDGLLPPLGGDDSHNDDI